MAALVGALRAMLTLDSTAFVDGSKKAVKSGNNLERSLKTVRKAAVAIGAVMVTAAAGLAVAIKGQLDAADNMGKAAQKFGVPVEQLSRLKYAADLSDVSLETLGASLGKLSKAMVSAANGSKSQAEMFAQIGVAVTDAGGKMRATEAVFQDVAEVFAQMPDGAEKTALAIKLFGKAGTELIPLLNAGKSGLAGMAAEADRLGIVIDAKTAKAAENFNDNLTRLKAAMGGVVTQITAALAPTLEMLSQYAVDLSNSFNSLSPATKEMIVQIGAAAGAVALAAAAFGLLSLALSPLNIAIAAIAAGAALIYANWDGIASYFSTLWTSITASTQAAWDAIRNAIGGAIDWVQAKWDTFVASLQSAVDKAKAVGAAVASALGGNPENIGGDSGYGGMGGAMDGDPGAMFGTGGGGSSASDTGRSTADGMVDGFKSRMAERQGEIAATAQSITNTVRSQLGIQSPSTVMREIGQHTTEGLAIGISDNVPMVQAAMAEVGDAVEGDGNSLQSRIESFKSTLEGAFVGLVTGAKSFKETIADLASSLADMFAKQAFQQLFSGIFGGGSGGGGFLSGLFAKGSAFDGGRVTAFAKGGVVSGATAFGMQGGLGVMGEAGPEAVMPLTRGPGGKLGVQAHGGGSQRIQLEISENEMFAARVSTIADDRSVQVVRRYDRDVAPQTRNRSERERG